MKKFALLLSLLLLLTLCGCNFNFTTSGIIGSAEALPVSEMVQAAADNDYAAFSAHLHPELSEVSSRSGFSLLSDYLAGSEVTSVECRAVNTDSSISSGGKTQTISVSYLVKLETGNLLVDAVYVKNSSGEGFTEFLCKIGIAP